MRTRPRRAVAVASAVIILSIVNLAIIGIAVGTRDDAVIAAQKADTARAFYSAENGLRVIAGEIGAGSDVPEGTLTLVGGFSVEITVLDDSGPVMVEVRGRAGSATRVIGAALE